MSDRGGLRHGVIVLAAGASTRLGQAKQLLRIDGETLVHRAVRLSLITMPTDCLVICSGNPGPIQHAVAALDCRSLACSEHELGMSASLRLGLDALDASCAGALIVLTDQPALEASHLCAMRDRWRAEPGRAIASGYSGTLGVPALLPRGWFAAVQSQQGDLGARELLRARSAEVHVVDAPQLARDIDKPEDLEQFGSGQQAS